MTLVLESISYKISSNLTLGRCFQCFSLYATTESPKGVPYML